MGALDDPPGRRVLVPARLGVTAEATRPAAARIADRCTPDQGCSDPRWCDPGPGLPADQACRLFSARPSDMVAEARSRARMAVYRDISSGTSPSTAVPACRRESPWSGDNISPARRPAWVHREGSHSRSTCPAFKEWPWHHLPLALAAPRPRV